ncbi:putative acetyltransferase [Sphaerisporangium sp. NPDC004334]
MIAVSPADVGRRVTVRRADPDGFRDTVGVLESWQDGLLQVRKRDGTLVGVREEALVAARVVPER